MAAAAPKQYGRHILLYGGISIFAVSAYTAIRIKENAPRPLRDSLKIQPGNMFNDFAEDYDSTIKWPEWSLGISWMRWWLLRNAKGHVLEVAAGTGTNLCHYKPKQIESLTLLDNSAAMLRKAAHKARDMSLRFPGNHPHMAFSGDHTPEEAQGGIMYVVHDGQRITSSCEGSSCHATLGSLTRAARRQAAEQATMRDAFAAAHAQAELPSTLEAAVESFSTVNKPAVEALRSSGPELRRQRAAANAFEQQFIAAQRAADGSPEHACCVAPRAFDTVVDTFGLCSVEDPVAMVNEMAAACKPDGRLLLLEHGVGSWCFDPSLERSTEAHKLRFGCSLNRDMDEILAQANVDIVSNQRWLFGLFSLIEARPKQANAEEI